MPRTALAVMLALAAVAGCGDSDNNAHGPLGTGIDGNEPLDQLNDDEKGRLCDWGATLYGGYGGKTTCEDGTTAGAPPSRDECITETFALCPATVAEFAPCAVKIHDLCVSGLFSTECQALVGCL
jgi:hypothetical protein